MLLGREATPHRALARQLGGAGAMFALRAGTRSSLRARTARCLAASRLLQRRGCLVPHALLHSASLPPSARGARTALQALGAGGAAVEEAPPGAQATPGGQYPFREVEARWQRHWEEHATFRTPEQVDTSKPKFYALDMFPYPRRAQTAALVACGQTLSGPAA